LRVIIVANGKLVDPETIRAELMNADLVIAADGGALHCLDLGIVPGLVVGDFDSLSPAVLDRLIAGGTAIQRHPAAKDETDLELALLAALHQGATHILIFGALGARWDMSMANVLLLAHPAFAHQQITLWADGQRISLLQAGQTHQLNGSPGDTVSLIPLHGDASGVKTEGLAYPLRDETLYFGATRGISNTLLGEQASVFIQHGALLCVQIRKSEHLLM
jgi:thiamine pyrophosphokinase